MCTLSSLFFSGSCQREGRKLLPSKYVHTPSGGLSGDVCPRKLFRERVKASPFKHKQRGADGALLTGKMVLSLGSESPPSTWHRRQLCQLHLPTLNSAGERSISLIEVKLTQVIKGSYVMFPVITTPLIM